MFKRVIVALIICFVLIMTLTSCTGRLEDRFPISNLSAESTATPTPSVEPIIRPDILPTPEWCRDWVAPDYPLTLDYSELEGDEVYDLYPFFDVLVQNNDAYTSSFYIYSDSGISYALINYWFLDYDEEIDHLNKLSCSYIEGEEGITLKITPDISYQKKDTIGCYPYSSNLKLLIKLEKDISGISVGSARDTISRFEGGKVYLQHHAGWVNGDMELVIPAEYESIYIMDTYSEEVYYMAKNSYGSGIFNEQYECIFSPELGYDNFFYLNGEFPIAVKHIERGNNRNYLIDCDGKALGEAFEGNVIVSHAELTTAFSNLDQVSIFTYKKDNKSLYGMVNSKLETVLPAVYEEIVPYNNGAYGQRWFLFFACKNKKEKYAIFLPDGTQCTDFKYDSAYDAYVDNRNTYEKRYDLE